MVYPPIPPPPPVEGAVGDARGLTPVDGAKLFDLYEVTPPKYAESPRESPRGSSSEAPLPERKSGPVDTRMFSGKEIGINVRDHWNMPYTDAEVAELWLRRFLEANRLAFGFIDRDKYRNMGLKDLVGMTLSDLCV